MPSQKFHPQILRKLPHSKLVWRLSFQLKNGLTSLVPGIQGIENMWRKNDERDNGYVKKESLNSHGGV